MSHEHNVIFEIILQIKKCKDGSIVYVMHDLNSIGIALIMLTVIGRGSHFSHFIMGKKDFIHLFACSGLIPSIMCPK